MLPGLAGTRDWLTSQVGELGRFDTETASAISRALSGEPSTEISPELTQEAWRKGIYMPGMQAIQEEAIPMLKDVFAQRGATFSTRMTESGRRLVSDFNRSATGVLANMLREDRIRSEGYAESAAQRSLQAVPQAMQASMLPAARGAAMTTALAPFQTFEQQKLDREVQEYYGITPWLQQAFGYTGQSQLAMYDATKQLSPWVQLLAGLGGEGMKAGAAYFGMKAAGAAAGASDKRLKKSIVYLTTELPINVATWIWRASARVLGLKGRGFGFIAQDVRRVWPELTTVGEDGFLRVQTGEVARRLFNEYGLKGGVV